MTSIDVSQVRRLASSLDQQGGRVGAKAAAGLRVSARAVEATQKELVAVDSGETRDSISTDFYGDGRRGRMVAVVGPTTLQGRLLELGTAKMAPRSFAGPSLDRHTATFVAAMERAAAMDL